MAFPSVASSATTEVTANGTSHTINMPSGITAGDLLVAFVTCDGDRTFTHTGWTKIADVAAVSAGVTEARHVVLTKTAAGSDTLTFGVSNGEQLSAIVYRITGHADVEIGTTGGTATSTNPDPPSLNASWGTADTLWIAACGWDNGNRTLSSYPSGWSENQVEASAASAGSTGTATATTTSTTTPQNPGTFTISNAEEWAAVTVAVEPAGGVPTDITPSAVATPVTVPAPAPRQDLTIGQKRWQSIPGNGAYDTSEDTPTGRIRLEWACVLNGGQSTIQAIASQDAWPNEINFFLRYQPDAQLYEYNWSTGGTSATQQTVLWTPAENQRPTGQFVYHAVEHDTATGDVKWYTSSDKGASWTLVETDTSTAGARFDSSSRVGIAGAHNAGSFPARGEFAWVRCWDYGASAYAWEFNANDTTGWTLTGTGVVVDYGDPLTVATPVAVPAPVVAGGVQISPAVVATPCAVPSPTVTAGADITPAAVATPVSVPGPTVAVTVTPTVVATPVSVPGPTVELGATLLPAAVPTPVAVPAPTITASADITPSAVATPVAVPAPTMIIAVTPAPVATPCTVHTPTIESLTGVYASYWRAGRVRPRWSIPATAARWATHAAHTRWAVRDLEPR